MAMVSPNTPNGIIFDAMQDAGILQDGGEPTSEQYAKYARRLRDLIITWMTTGLRLWLNVDTSVTLTAGLQTYSFGPSGTTVMAKPLRVVEGYYLDSSSNKRPLTPLAWNDWIRLSNNTTQGPITSYFEDKQQTNLVVKFWLVPDTDAATGTAHLLLQTRVTNFTSLTETMNFPEEWRLALRWGLAADICTGQPESVIARCEKWAVFYKEILDSWDVEDASTQIQPDSQMRTSGGFR